MKKLSIKQKLRDKKKAFIHRCGKRHKKRNKLKSKLKKIPSSNWFKTLRKRGVDFNLNKKGHIILYLPEIMNLNENYNSTILTLSVIRKFSEKNKTIKQKYRLKSVNFDNLKSISTSAALVLTAELSKWDDAIRQRLRPATEKWDSVIYEKFYDIGFFDLFKNNEKTKPKKNKKQIHSDVKVVKYIKGKCGDSKKTRILKEELYKIVGKDIEKWHFLRSGLDEAITNVTHHAYPDLQGFHELDKNWYLTGSYNEKSGELKIVFYDQGVGIPKSLPASDIWEKILVFLTKFSMLKNRADEVLLKAAVELDRTSTGQSDRGKGLQDLLEFIRHRKNGYLSILSLKGLFKYSMVDGIEYKKSEHFDYPICGTLIIWSVNLLN